MTGSTKAWDCFCTDAARLRFANDLGGPAMIAAIEQITRTAAAALTGALLLLPMVTPVGHAADGALPRFAQASGPGGSSNRAASPPAQSAAAPAAGIDQEIAQ